MLSTAWIRCPREVCSPQKDFSVPPHWAAGVGFMRVCRRLKLSSTITTVIRCCLRQGWEHFLGWKNLGRPCQKWLINRPPPPSLLPIAQAPGPNSLSPTWHSLRWVLISTLAFSTAHIQVFPGQEHTLLSPALLALEPSGSFLESLDIGRNRMVIFACQEECYRPTSKGRP